MQSETIQSKLEIGAAANTDEKKDSFKEKDDHKNIQSETIQLFPIIGAAANTDEKKDSFKEKDDHKNIQSETIQLLPIIVQGDHKTHVSKGGRADLHKYYNDCKKNPGHIEFIPVDTFTLNHLPEGHCDNDLYELIKLTAELTVRVNVKSTSPHRPKFWPGTKVSYPFYNMRDKTNWRTGSGLIGRVYKFTDGGRDLYRDKHRKNYTTCWCKKCKHSDTASHVWCEFDVYTASHVVYDDTEASHTSLRLFYDRDDSPVVSVDQVSVVDVNIERDRCRLKCVTCDKNLGDKLSKLWEYYEVISRTVFNKYLETRDVDKLCIIVSHPHGCSKKVSVGHWVDKYDLGNDFKKFTYTTCTCPGSTGAAVHCVGYSCGSLVHSGSLNSKLNYSGTGICY